MGDGIKLFIFLLLFVSVVVGVFALFDSIFPTNNTVHAVNEAADTHIIAKNIHCPTCNSTDLTPVYIYGYGTQLTFYCKDDGTEFYGPKERVGF